MAVSSVLTHSIYSRALPLSFAFGLTFGFLGHHIIKKKSMPSSQKSILMIDMVHRNSFVCRKLTPMELEKEISVDALNGLRESVHWGKRSVKIWKDVLNTSTSIVCIRKDKRLIGYGSFVGNGRMGTIFDVCVHPNHQKQRIGTLLMNSLIKTIKLQDYAFVGLFGWEENAGALNFYKKFGFHPQPFAMESSSQKLCTYSARK